MYRTIFRGGLILATAVTGLFAATGGALASTSPSSTDTPHMARMAQDASTPALGNFVINPASTVAYFTVPTENEVLPLDLTTDAFGSAIPVGSDPQGIDITPNGKTLYVADSGGQTISKVTIATGKVTPITTPAGFLNDTPYSIVVMNNGNALYSTTFAGSGFGANVYDLNLTTDTSTLVSNIGINSEVTEVTQLSRSGNHAAVGAVLGDDSGGPFDVYTAATGDVVSGSLNAFVSSAALNQKGTTMVVDGSYVIDPTSGSLLGTINDDCVSATLTSSGSSGYCLETNSIVALDVSTFLTGTSIALPSGVTGTGEIAISPNGDTLVAVTSAGAAIVSL
jgi:hypothetical protein